jgi:L-lactate dehydrogenase complex protein LldE
MECAMTEKIALFVTCLVDQIFPEVGVASVKLLRRYGFEVDFPKGQTCCGQPFLNSGFIPEAQRLARQTIEILEPYDAVVIPGGSCTGIMRKDYQHLFEGQPEWQSRAAKTTKKFYELSEFLAANTTLQPKKNAKLSVTYHDSCHMLRLAGIKTQPRQLLRQVGCEIQEMEESDRCCGFGGVFSVRMGEVSRAMTGYKLKRAHQSQAPVLVTSDPGCLMQMKTHQEDLELLRVEHLAVILEELAA